MKQQSHIINDAQPYTELPSIIFKDYDKSSESRVVLKFKAHRVNPTISNILGYLEYARNILNVPKLKDILIVSNQANVIKTPYPDVTISATDEVINDFEVMLSNHHLSSIAASLSTNYTKYNAKVIILDLATFTTSERIKINHIVGVFRNMVIELRVTTQQSNKDVRPDKTMLDDLTTTDKDIMQLQGYLFEDSRSERDLTEWLIHYSIIVNVTDPKVLYKDYTRSCSKVYSFKYFKSILYKYNNRPSSKPE